MIGIVFVLLAGLAINSHNSGGVASGSEGFHDVKDSIVKGYSQDHYVGFKTNE